MSSKLRKFYRFALFLCFCSPALANTVYLSQSGGTFSGGSACNGQTAQAYTYFNSSGNWTSGTPSGNQIGPGTTVYICGQIKDSTAGDSNDFLSFQGSGTSTNPISLVFDSGASVVSPGWNAAAIELNGKSYIVVNGGTNGLIESTLNGTSGQACPGGTCQYAYNGAGVYGASASSNITVENLTVGPMYQRYCPSGQEANCGDENGESTAGIYLQGGSNITVQNNKCLGSWACIGYGPQAASASNISFLNNTIYQSNIGIQISNGSSGDLINGIVVAGNNIYDGYNWSDAANNNHHDGMHIFAVASGSENENLQVYNNFVHGNWGDGVNAWIFIECNNGGTCPSPQVFNNILEDDTTVGHAGNGLLSVDGTNPLIANNTMNGAIGGSIAGLWSGTGATIENNVEENTYGVLYPYTSAAKATTYDYNVYYQIGTGGWNQSSFAAWKTSCSCDSHSTNGTSPNFAGGTGAATDYLPTSTSTVVIKQGQNLAAQSINPLTADYAGAYRPGSGPCSTTGTLFCWDIGAYNYTPTPQPAPPKSVVANSSSVSQ